MPVRHVLFVIGGTALSLSAIAPVHAWSGGPSLAAIAIAPEDIGRAEKIAAADDALQGGRLVEAQALLDQLGTKPDGKGAEKIELLRAELMVANRKPDEARAALASLAGRDVPACRYATAYALADMQGGQLADAQARLRGHEPDCGDEPVFWSALGQASLALEQPQAAVEAYRRALQLRPDNDMMRNDLAVALMASGDATAAAELLRDLSRRRPDDSDVTINLDFAAGMMGQMPQRHDTDNASFWSFRLQSAGLGARKAGLTGMAEALFSQALLARPRHDPELWRQYSEVSGVK